MEGEALFLDASADGQGWGPQAAAGLCFGRPAGLRRAESLAEVPAVVAWAEAEAKAGRWAVLALAYEAAPAFDDALCVHPPMQGLPLAWAASHAGPIPGTPASGPHAAGPWQALVPPERYAGRFARLQELIRAGETYQTNYTIPFECAFSGDSRAWFARLAEGRGAGFCAWLDLGRHRALCLSPELFFDLDACQDGREVLARPMKGTAPRGATPEEDAALRAALEQSPKDRAENVMIVDLLRSDLGRVARTGTVRAQRLFAVAAYPTLFQMTSDVRATLREGVGLPELLAALFPCGSVTGAPKVRTMQIIRELEPEPRGLYCGAIGLLEPGGRRMRFCVPIRTILLDAASGRARYSAGGGVTHDSRAGAEHAECLTKLRCVLGPADAFRLIESLLLLRGRYPLLALHLERLERSAGRLGFALDREAVLQALGRLAAQHSAGDAAGRCKARLELSRDGRLCAEAAPISGGRVRLRVGLAPAPVDSGDPLLAHKTTRRAHLDAALAARPDADDLLFVNERGELTESTRANLVLQLDGELATPAAASGLLPGVFREKLLRRGIVRERVLFPADLHRARRVWLVNSVRGWMPARMAF